MDGTPAARPHSGRGRPLRLWGGYDIMDIKMPLLRMKGYGMMKKVCSIALALCLVCSSLVFTSSAAATDDGLEQFNTLAQSIVTMDPDVSPEQVDDLLAQLEVLDLDGEEEQNTLTGSMVGGDAQSVQMLFAQLQLQLAQSNKEKAMERIQAIQAAQEQSNQITAYINTARELYSKNRIGVVKAVPEDMLQFLQDHSLYVPEKPSSPSEEDWKAVIWSLETFQEGISTNVQQQMVYVQDYIGQYNQYSSQTSALLDSDALKGLSGSATMLGAGGAGLAVTALVMGLAVGSLATALVLRRKQSKA